MTSTTDLVFVLRRRESILGGFYNTLAEAQEAFSRKLEYYQSAQGVIFAQQITRGSDHGRAVVVSDNGDSFLLVIEQIEHHDRWRHLGQNELVEGEKARIGLF